jgi:small-conductance mechanosensitive channel
MWEKVLNSALWSQDWVVALEIFVGYLLAAVLVRLFWIGFLHLVARVISRELADSMLTPARRLFVAILLILGAKEALESLHAIANSPNLLRLIDNTGQILLVIVVVLALMRMLNAALSWYIRRAAEHSDKARAIFDHAALVRKTATAIAVVVAVFSSLGILGINTSPLLASGAIGGLAVAWAFQDTLSNMFAGYFLTIDSAVSVGDCVLLASGEEGYIQAIEWRNTRIRTTNNNTVLIPNAKLSQAMLTNYSQPTRDMQIVLPCQIAYDSDLDEVEQVTLAVARRIQQEVTGADPDWEPVIRWKEFGDYGIRFNTVLRVMDYEFQFVVQSEFIKALHDRYRTEGIEMPLQTQKVLLAPTEQETRNGYRGAAEEKADETVGTPVRRAD